MFTIFNFEVSLNPANLFKKKSEKTPVELAAERRARLVEECIRAAVRARNKCFMRVTNDPDAEILPRVPVQTTSKSPEFAYSAAFQDHTFTTSTATNYAGLKPVKKARRTVPRGNVSFPEQVTLKFHSSDDYLAPFFDTNKPTKMYEPENAITEQLLRFAKRQKLNNKNDVLIVSGKVGSGKSTILSNFLAKLEGKVKAQEKARPAQRLATEFAIIDLESLTLDGDTPLDDFIATGLVRFIADEISEQTYVKGSSLEELVKGARGKNLVLVFDNLDAAYHSFCVSALLHADEIDEVSKANIYHPLVFRIINEFVHGTLKGLGATVVFAIRDDTVTQYTTRLETRGKKDSN